MIGPQLPFHYKMTTLSLLPTMSVISKKESLLALFEGLDIVEGHLSRNSAVRNGGYDLS